MAFGFNTAWVLGGITSEWDGWASPENLIPGMTQFNMTSRTFSNSTVQCCNATAGIYKGALEHVPSFGPAGIFIAMGGQNGIGNNGITAGLIDFGTVSIFDPAKQEWWNQTTTGSKPIPRVEFCTAGISSTSGTYEMLEDLFAEALFSFRAKFPVDSFMLAGAPISEPQLFNTIQLIS